MAPDQYAWWRHRRRHSYLALAASIAETAVLAIAWINGGDLARVEPLIWPSYIMWASVVGAYIGTSIVDDIKSRQLGQHPESRQR